jgi:hypothetical protein
MIFPLWDRITQKKIDLLCFRLRRGLGSHRVLQSKRNPLFKRPIGTSGGRDFVFWIFNFGLGSHWVLQFERIPLFKRSVNKEMA